MVKYLGAQVNKISAHKKEIKEEVKDLSFTFNAKITNVTEKKKVEGGSIMSAIYSFNIDYNASKKKIADIVFEGEVLMGYPEESAKNLLKEWKKAKKVDKAMLVLVEKFAYEHAVIEAVSVAKTLKLPVPIPLSSLFKKQQS